ncbi:aminopeptidase N [Angustibacter sp. McL0619]|uniref:aminopeptidase N n=1 Tax=Angustibacter sp. McL0619 TaxID=3415676 RepID=UPI003CE89C02
MAKALTRDEAIARHALLDVHSYEIDLDLSGAGSEPTFESEVLVRFTASAAEPTWLELKSEAVLAADLNGASVDASAWADGRLPLDGLVTDGPNELRVRARFAYSRTGEGLHRYTDPEDQNTYLYSQAFLDDAPRIFGCFDQPDLKATMTLTVTAPADWTVLSNTPGKQTGPGHWAFEPTEILSTYLFAVVAGPYHGVREVHDGIEIGVWCRQSWARHLDAERLLRTTRQGFDYFHGLFGVRYPFGKYDQAFVPEFNAGAMENPGLVTFRDEYYLQRGTVTADDREEVANTQLHEMAHMWFGDLVTMKWWNDLWLNESFAEYMAYRCAADATEHTGSWTTFLAKRKTWGYLADQFSTTHPVAGEADDTAAALLNFDGISYAKGASALRQLVEWVGDDAFLAALRRHFDDHAYANASLADLVDALTLASGRDVSAWGDLWLRTSGVSTFGLELAVDDERRYSAATLTQTSPTELRPHRLRVGLYDLDGAALVLRSSLDVDLPAEPRHEVTALVGEPAAALVLPNDGDLTFALLNLDPASLRVVHEKLRGLSDPLARALVWFALVEMVGAGRLSTGALVEQVCTSITDADPEAVTERLLRATVTAADRWAEPSNRTAQLARLADWLDGEVRAAGAGGDRQLALARMLVRISPHPERLRAWLAGADLPDGLTVDADLRWRAVHRLATLGALDDAAITAERERDTTSAGANFALTARAALPSAEAKAAAWSSAVEGRLSNHELLAVATGFWSADQAELLSPYVQRFAEDYPEFARSQSTEMAALFGRFMFPATMVSAQTVQVVQGMLDNADLPPIARRMLAEGRDELERGLRARSAG